MNNKTRKSDSTIPQEQYRNSYPNNEIDLAGIVRLLIIQKKIIFFVTLVATLGALLFVFLQPVTYQVKMVLRPPTKVDVEYFNLQLGNLFVGNMTAQKLEAITDLTVSQGDLFQMFLDELRSKSLRRAVFNENYLVAGKKQNVVQKFVLFNKRITLPFYEKKKNGNQLNKVSITFEDKSPQLAADILNILGERAAHKATKTAMLNAEVKINILKKTLNSKIETLFDIKKIEVSDEIIRLQEVDNIKRKALHGQIVAIKEQAHKKRADRISRLAAGVAFVANDSQMESQLVLRGNETGIKETLATMQILKNILPLYWYGEEVLWSEFKLRGYEEQFALLEKNEQIEALKARKDLAPFMPEVRGLQRQLALLKGINFDPNMIRSVIIDQAAYPPVAPKPTRDKLIVALGLILGLMMGIFIVFFMDFVGNIGHKESKVSL